MDLGQSVQDMVTTVLGILPTLLVFLAILIIGYIVAKVITKVITRVLHRAGFDRAVERGGVKKALEHSAYDPSEILGKIVFYAIFLFVLQMAFGVFGPNPISALLFGVIAFLPKVFVALLIIVVAAAIAAGVREIVAASLGGLPYGRLLAGLAGGAILAVGVFAALNQVEIAPAVVNGLFYAVLALIVGSGIVAIGGGGIRPMQRRWEHVLARYDEEAPRVREEARSSRGARRHADQPQTQVQSSAGSRGEPTRPSDVQAGGTPPEPPMPPPATPRA